MSNRVLIIGGVAGGASAAARVRRLDEHAEIVMFERGPYVSFSNCALPFHLSGIVENSDDLVLMTPWEFEHQYNIEARVNSEVIKINRADKTVDVKNCLTGEVTQERYDELVLSPGANAIMPRSITGIDSEHVFSVRNVPDIAKIKKYIDDNSVEDIVVVGAGFIGLEVAENLRIAGKNVTIVEAAPQVLTLLDYDMAQTLHHEIMKHGVDLIVSDSVTEITDNEVILNSGKHVSAKAVVMAIGVTPEVSLAKDADLELGVTGGIKVNHHYQTNDPHIYAVGDAIEVTHFITKKPTRLTLAGPAQRQARAAAGHMYGKTYRNKGVIGSSVVQCFDLNVATTGLNSLQCEKEGIDHRIVYVIPGDKVGLMPDSNPLFFKLIIAYPSGQILGAQALGKGAADKRIDVIATMITMNGNLEDLAELELSYSPMYSTAKDVVNHAALVGLNLLNGDYKQVEVSEVRGLVESGAFIIDAREPDEYAEGHLVTSVNIPLSQFRGRLNEIPKDQPVYVHCRSAQRSYNMTRALNQLGYDNVFNISGSYLGISEFEWYNDQVLGRKPIVTEYNFN
ncbi:FAD-dependent oxidoreductase [Erysipelothrix sp. HDW6A]|uniref:FAD-dependent oxidoreductase n=1 Tax=Erysipelothrix sp. HDW6A TaxID=2714928 RepID=UPI0014081C1B|nr:FAD-dependent oxidoreductase [Erysipelothrix sp. HDW6A]QIK58033.1 FAD-dependent oxidoreductase [Erysipelothrix sp. HDW6A]